MNKNQRIRIKEIKERLKNIHSFHKWSLDFRHCGFYEYENNTIGPMKELNNKFVFETDDESLGAQIEGMREPCRGQYMVKDAWFIFNAPSDILYLLQVIKDFENKKDD